MDDTTLARVRATPVPALLCTYEMAHARDVGSRRQAFALTTGLRDKFAAGSFERWGFHIEGAAAELVVARHLGIFWQASVGDTKAEDVGPVQVRLNADHAGTLRIRPRDRGHRDDPFVLVTGATPGLMIRGWCVAHEGVALVRPSDPGGRGAPCWCIPQEALRPMPELIERLVRRADGGWRFAGD